MTTCTEIRASDGVYFNVRGQLYVAGHPDQPATFMSSSPNPSRGAWGGIQLGERSNSKAHLSSANINDAVNGFSFDVCGRGCVVSVDKCIFRNNEIAIHGYIGGEDDVVEIRDTDITDNTCGSDGGWKNFVGCSFSGNDWGLCNGESVNLHSCTISNNVVGLEGSRGRVENCYISDNSEVGVAPTFEGYELIGNTIINNKTGIIAGGWDGIVSPVHENVICNNVDYDIQMSASFDLDATSNWWCTTDPAEIAQRIWDVYDDSNLGQVIFEPFLDQEP